MILDHPALAIIIMMMMMGNLKISEYFILITYTMRLDLAAIKNHNSGQSLAQHEPHWHIANHC